MNWSPRWLLQPNSFNPACIICPLISIIDDVPCHTTVAKLLAPSSVRVSPCKVFGGMSCSYECSPPGGSITLRWFTPTLSATLMAWLLKAGAVECLVEGLLWFTLQKLYKPPLVLQVKGVFIKWVSAWRVRAFTAAHSFAFESKSVVMKILVPWKNHRLLLALRASWCQFLPSSLIFDTQLWEWNLPYQLAGLLNTFDHFKITAGASRNIQRICG